MNKIIISFAALAAISTGAFAERNYDLRDSQETRGSFSLSHAGTNSVQPVQLLAIDHAAVDAIEIRRLDEKNGTKG